MNQVSSLVKQAERAGDLSRRTGGESQYNELAENAMFPKTMNEFEKGQSVLTSRFLLIRPNQTGE
jgi:hypothetical protein